MKNNVIAAKDLRIGNWVSVPACAAHWQVTRIEADICSIDDSNHDICEEDNTFKYDEIHGIPLTVERLDKLGILFSNKWGGFNSEQAVYSHNEFCIIGNFNDGFRLLNDRSEWERDIKYKYVHQLQNLYFALTGEDITIFGTI